MLEHAEPQWAVNQNADAQLRSQWQHPPLRISKSRIVRQLNHVQATSLHHVAQVIERARKIVRRPDRGDLAIGFELLEHAQLGFPGHQVVHLVDLDPTV